MNAKTTMAARQASVLGRHSDDDNEGESAPIVATRKCVAAMKAEAAVKIGDEDLARAALERKAEIVSQREAAATSLEDQYGQFKLGVKSP